MLYDVAGELLHGTDTNKTLECILALLNGGRVGVVQSGGAQVYGVESTSC
tara:strand:+ start:618 stop:767 length:150 start_codon:yes stop_codon:yes gene_type:complete